MWEPAHLTLRAVYAVLPIFYAGILFNRFYRLRQRAALRQLVSTAVAALAIGGALTTVFSLAVSARVRVDQVLLAGLYFFAVLIVLKGLDAVSQRVGRVAFRVDPSRREPAPARGQGERSGSEGAPRIRDLLADPGRPAPRWRRVAAGTLRAAVLAGVGLPYVMAAAMAYRPKVGLASDPYDLLRWRFEPVSFPATDGVKISGWYVPAAPMPAGTPPELAGQWARRTVIVCHGLGANKLNQLHMGRAFHARGWNLLAIDFRAHGASAGQFSTFGDHERRDVLGAVRWLKLHHASNARQVVGVGASLGAAALIAAAGETGVPESAQIDGLVIYATYADLGELATEITRDRMPPVAGPLARTLSLPLASLHSGANLAAFAPVRSLAAYGARPIFFVHGRRDEIIPFHHAEQLYAAAGGRKRLVALDEDHNGIIEDEAVAEEGARFFD